MAVKLPRSCLLRAALVVLASCFVRQEARGDEDAVAIEVDIAAVEVVGGVDAAAEPAPAPVDAKAADAGAKGAEAEGEEQQPPPEPATPGESILKDLDFDPADKQYDEKLASLFLDADALAEVRRKITELDAEDFRLRNEASKALAMVEAPIEHLLGGARKDAGIEMSRRIQGILNVRVSQRRLDALYHAAERIAEAGTPGFAERLLVIAGTFEPAVHWDLLRMLELAVAKSAGEQQADLFRDSLDSEFAAVRETAAFALAYGGQQAKAATGAGEDNQAELLLARARGLAAAAKPEASAQLLTLLSSDMLRARHEAGLLLRGIHGRDFGFAGYDSPERRAVAVERWENFLGGAAAGTEPKPVLLGAGARAEYRVLVGKRPGKEGAVLAWTTSGKSVGPHELSAAMGGIDPKDITFDDAAGLIIASGGGKEDGRITIFTSEGAELWNATGLPAGGGAAVVPGGRLLVAIGKEVEEVGVTGERVGRWELGKSIASFARLRDNRFLCVHPEEGEVAEYDTSGKLLWKLGGFTGPQSVERLPNGNLFIVTDLAKNEPNAANAVLDVTVELLETDPSGTIIARIQPKGVTSITSAARLPNGNTLVGTEKGLAEYTPEGYASKVWLKTPISSLHVR